MPESFLQGGVRGFVSEITFRHRDRRCPGPRVRDIAPLARGRGVSGHLGPQRGAGKRCGGRIGGCLCLLRRSRCGVGGERFRQDARASPRHRHSRQQRRHRWPDGGHVGVSRRGVEAGHGGRSLWPVLLLPCHRPRHDRARLRTDRQRRVDCRKGGESKAERLQRCKGRFDRPHEVARKRAG